MQQKRLFERAREAGCTDEAAVRAWFEAQGIHDTRTIKREHYDDIVSQLLIDRPGAAAAPPPDPDPRVQRALATRDHA
jgi:hypothetical protein